MSYGFDDMAVWADMAVCLMVLMAICRVFRFEFMARDWLYWWRCDTRYGGMCCCFDGDLDGISVWIHGSKGGLSGGLDCMGFIYGRVTRGMAACLTALMAIWRAFQFEFMAIRAVCQAALRAVWWHIKGHYCFIDCVKNSSSVHAAALMSQVLKQLELFSFH